MHRPQNYLHTEHSKVFNFNQEVFFFFLNEAGFMPKQIILQHFKADLTCLDLKLKGIPTLLSE